MYHISAHKIKVFKLIMIIHSFSHEFIRCPLKSFQRRPSPTTRYRLVSTNLQNALSLFLDSRRISKGNPFQVEGPTMENARRCLVAAVARGTKIWLLTGLLYALIFSFY